MNYELFRKQKKLVLLGNAAVGALLIGAGLFTGIKGITALAFIPLAMAGFSGVLLVMLKKYPRKMLPMVISETDERIKAVKNHSDSITLRLLRWALTLVFLGYTFLVPDDIFVSPMWWITFVFFFLSHMLQAFLFKHLYGSKPNK